MFSSFASKAAGAAHFFTFPAPAPPKTPAPATLLKSIMVFKTKKTTRKLRFLQLRAASQHLLYYNSRSDVEPVLLAVIAEPVEPKYFGNVAGSEIKY